MSRDCWQPGAQIGSYRILSLLGAGGMGEVYRAHDARLGRDIAVKVLPRELADQPDRRARLLREARAAAALNHPNICTIHDVGEADGHVYIAMELVEGQPLSARLAAGPLPPGDVLRYGLQLADAMAHAHDRAVVHRDLKSANVMITPDGRVKVLDFGLARRVSVESVAETATRSEHSLTRPGTLVGTLPYMAPEQLRAEPADARSDVWAIGIVLYEMAAGGRPFNGRTEFELSSAILHDTPAPISARLPAALQAVTSRCLEKEPSRRYQRAGEVRAALEAVGSHASADVAPRPASGGRRSRLIPAAAAAALVGLAGGAVWLNLTEIRQRFFGASSDQIRSIAVLPLENLSGDADEEYFVAGMHEALITDLARIGVQKIIAKPSSDAFKGSTKPLRDIGRELGVDGIVTGAVRRARDRLQITAQLVRAATGEVLWANRYERSAGDVLALQNEIVGAIAREVHAKVTPAQRGRLAAAPAIDAAAHDAYLKGRFFFSNFGNSLDLKHLDTSIAQFQQASRIDPNYAPPYAALSFAYEAGIQSSLFSPKDTFPLAKAAAEKAVQLDDTLAEAHSALATVFLWHDWNWAGAAHEIQRALELNPDSVDALVVQETYAALVTARFDDAAATSHRILTLDPLNQFSRIQAAWVPFNARRYDESLLALKSLFEVYPNHVWGRFFAAMNYGAKQMPREVGVECGKVMTLLGGAYNMQAIGLCVWAHGVTGQSAEARRLLDILVHPPSGTWMDPTMMGVAYGAVGDVDRAIAWCQKGMDERAPNMIYLKVAATWDSVRADPRFQKLLGAMHFPP